MNRSSLKSRLAEGETIVGAWVMTRSPSFVELASAIGLDFVLIDLEHGALQLSDVEDLLRCVKGSGTSALVRLPSHDTTLIGRVLDRGAHGVVLPRVESAEVAAVLAAAARFPPVGTRGMAIGAARASQFGTIATYRAEIAPEALIVMQIESKAALAASVAIGTAPGVDVAFIGPTDLAGDLRLEAPGDAAELGRIVAQTGDALRAAGVICATVPHAGRSWQDLAASGFRMVVPFSDIGMLRDGLFGARHAVDLWRGA